MTERDVNKVFKCVSFSDSGTLHVLFLKYILVSNTTIKFKMYFLNNTVRNFNGCKAKYLLNKQLSTWFKESNKLFVQSSIRFKGTDNGVTKDKVSLIFKLNNVSF